MASPSKRRSTRQLETRKRSRYAEPETDDDLMSPDEDDDYELPRELAPSPRKRQRVSRVRHKPKTRSKSAATKKTPLRSPAKKRRVKPVEIGKPRRARGARRARDKSRPSATPSNGVIPPWTTLPAEILKDIFIFAGQPVAFDNATWLVGAARTCRAFMEPALEALYSRPAIWRPVSLWQLLSLLRKKDGRLLNYNSKIKQLDFDVRRLSYSAHNKPLFNVSDLLLELPRLQHLEIIHPEDEPPYRVMAIQSWCYPDSLFMSLDTAQIRLTSWRWTYEMVKNRSGTSAYEFMTDIHRTKAFENLRELTLCGFLPTVTDRLPTPIVEGERQDLDLTHAISALPSLRDISLISCDVVEKEWLSGLPVNLERLNLSNCQYVYTENLTSFLSASGSKLKELILNHNPAVSLSFLPTLKSSCPDLQVLEMDLHFYSRYFNISQMDPEYDELLHADEIPTWPTTMRKISLVHMQKWNSTGASNLFQSLVDTAPALPDLRSIVLHSHIDVPWRDRAKFRDDWSEKLQHVFSRPNRAPFKHNGSKLQYSLWKQRQPQFRTAPAESQPLESPVKPPSSDDAPATNDSSQRRSQRVADASEALQRQMLDAQAVTEQADSSASEEDLDLADDAVDRAVPGAVFVHRLCDVVDIRIDNQRPRENQFTEQDFLDSEASGDDDWQANDAFVEVNEQYAW